ncbi:hypothetical protein GOODEAATRI_010026 [Goodea atripinnis]|uniref:Uncharacterized protein n=1 Tax=Goodea atripinnis TaxID=208336 RepID=A0ABV0MQT0_9TELE
MVYPLQFLLYELLVVMTVCHWSCRNTLEARSPMSCDMTQGEGVEPMNGPCGEAAEQEDEFHLLQSQLDPFQDPMLSSSLGPYDEDLQLYFENPSITNCDFIQPDSGTNDLVLPGFNLLSA